MYLNYISVFLLCQYFSKYPYDSLQSIFLLPQPFTTPYPAPHHAKNRPYNLCSITYAILPVFIFILIKSPNSFLPHQKNPALSSNPRNTRLRSGQEYHAPRHRKTAATSTFFLWKRQPDDSFILRLTHYLSDGKLASTV